MQQIEIDKDGFLSFDAQKSFNINGSDYPPQLFKELLIALTNSFHNSRQNDIHPAIKKYRFLLEPVFLLCIKL
ncbi:hypothetical protein [Bacillus wiedmannii]|uniref:hypothetical protein n=1 Tax=Bacillus wiedmannii TaxID=1890302 RepID=UPI00019FDD49|nr:hypothetical protein [Bacillus wiedmannii]EEK66913.1 hypothetical protein bcere0006_29620 [Bacillus wiedmannii]MCC2424737.1 hypothetical protein [Bacillus wiedmannii]MED3397985.1 hypothetical protein [Bacillus wiedmannii]